MTPNTHCRIASISKSLTAVVAARLVEREPLRDESLRPTRLLRETRSRQA
jgi:hypothetical protein